MSLRVIRRSDTRTLQIVGTIRPAGATEGIRIRQRASSTNLALAKEEAAAIEARILRDAWHGKRVGTVSFYAAAESYLSHEPRTHATKALIARLLRHFGDVPLSSVDQTAVDDARRVLLKFGAGPATVRRGLFTPLAAILNHAAHPSRRWCDPPRFDIPAEPRGRTRFMVPHQVDALFEAAGSSETLFRFLVCTGCRVSEALGLAWEDVDLHGARAILYEGETKSGNRRIVTLPPAAVACLGALQRRDGCVFLTSRGLPYRDNTGGGGQIKTTWKATLRRAELPAFTPHDLRHTWASWHYRLHRDLLRLKVEGGWAQVRMVERYAHVMPSGHDEDICRIWGLPNGSALER
jgi:integrase